jgi:hypothetical protein
MPEPEKQVAARERSFSGSYRSTLKALSALNLVVEHFTILYLILGLPYLMM